jgi:hypothetical protein
LVFLPITLPPDGEPRGPNGDKRPSLTFAGNNLFGQGERKRRKKEIMDEESADDKRRAIKGRGATCGGQKRKKMNEMGGIKKRTCPLLFFLAFAHFSMVKLYYSHVPTQFLYILGPFENLY